MKVCVLPGLLTSFHVVHVEHRLVRLTETVTSWHEAVTRSGVDDMQSNSYISSLKRHNNTDKRLSESIRTI